MSSAEENGVNSNELPFTLRALSSVDWRHTHTHKDVTTVTNTQAAHEHINTDKIIIMACCVSVHLTSITETGQAMSTKNIFNLIATLFYNPDSKKDRTLW